MKNITYIIIIAVFMGLLFSFDKHSQNYIITASISEEAVEGGMQILKEGGTAMDAALSVALSEIAATGGKYISYAGILNIVYFEKSTGKIHNMNASFNTLRDETNPETIPSVTYGISDTSKTVINGRAILVPGFMKGVEEAHIKFGNQPFNRIFENAIHIADEGVIWSEEDENKFKTWKKVLTQFSATKNIFLKSNDSYYSEGDLFKQPLLSSTLRKVSEEGADYMYTGKWAEKFVATAQSAGSKITMQDMKDYQVIWSEALHGLYNNYDIYVPGVHSTNGVRLIESLNIAEVANLKEKEHYSESPNTLSFIFEILKASLYSNYYAENNPSFFGDSISLTTESRLKKSTSKAIWNAWLSRINEQQTHDNSGNHSAAIVGIDKYGNMVALIHSIKTVDWGTTGLFIDGVSIPDAASLQQENIRMIGCGNRLPDETIPGIIMKKGKPVLGFSCIGPGLHNQTFTSIINVLDYQMTPMEAIKTSGIGNIISDGNLKISIQPNILDDSLLINANKLGFDFVESGHIWGFFWSGVSCDEKTGELKGTKVWLK